MGKRSKRHAGEKKITSSPSPALLPDEPLLSHCGKKVMISGVFSLVLGFWILSLTDPAGQNWASTLSPFLLIAGYVLIGIGLVVKDPISIPASPPPLKK